MLLSQRNIEGGDMRIGLALAMLIASGSAQAQTPPLRPDSRRFARATKRVRSMSGVTFFTISSRLMPANPGSCD